MNGLSGEVTERALFGVLKTRRRPLFVPYPRLRRLVQVEKRRLPARSSL